MVVSDRAQLGVSDASASRPTSSSTRNLWRLPAAILLPFGRHAIGIEPQPQLTRPSEVATVVQSFLGHKNASETLDTYGHLWPGDEDRIRAAIDVGLSQAQAKVAS